MANKMQDHVINFHQIPGIKKYWGWFLIIGLLLMVLGALAIGYAHWATEFTVILLGFLLTIAGILQVISGFYAIKWTGFSLSLLLGIFYIIAGALCVFKPWQSAEAISLLIAVLLLVGGFFRIISAVRYRFDHWGWVVFSGLISVFLGFLILAEWPESGLWVIGLFVGVDMLITGSYWVGLSFAARKRL